MEGWGWGCNLYSDLSEEGDGDAWDFVAEAGGLYLGATDMEVLVVEQLLVEVGCQRRVADAVRLAGLGPRPEVLLIGLLCRAGHVELGGG